MLDKVQGGETVLILDRDTPIAKIERYNQTESGIPEALVREGVVVPGDQSPKKLPPLYKSKQSVLQNLLRDRNEGQ